MRGPISTLPRTVCHGKSVGCWKTMPRSAPGPSTGSPLTSTWPVDGVKKPAIILRMRGLAAARRPDEHDELAGLDREVDVGDGDRLLLAADERVRDAADLDALGTGRSRVVGGGSGP